MSTPSGRQTGPTKPSVPARRRIAAHAAWELRLLLRNGEQLLLMFVIPIALLVGLHASGIDAVGASVPVPTIIAVCVMATSFTSLAIGTGFERRAGSLEFLGTTPLTRIDLLAGKLVATAVLAGSSVAAVIIVGRLLGWQSEASWSAGAVTTGIGCAAFACWAIALAGLLRAEAVLALANGIFVLLMVFGGVLISPASMPAPLGALVGLLPSGVLAQGLRLSLDSDQWPWLQFTVLAGWAIAGALLARRTFRWAP